MNRANSRGVLLVATAFLAIPAFAQVDFSGEWAPRFYEDQLERVPGPELAESATSCAAAGPTLGYWGQDSASMRVSVDLQRNACDLGSSLPAAVLCALGP